MTTTSMLPHMTQAENAENCLVPGEKVAFFTYGSDLSLGRAVLPMSAMDSLMASFDEDGEDTDEAWDGAETEACEELWCFFPEEHPVYYPEVSYPEAVPAPQSIVPPFPRRIGPYIKKPIDNKLRWEVFRRDGYQCVKCSSLYDLTADHVYPEVLGGPTILSNLQTLCRPCNSRKGARV